MKGYSQQNIKVKGIIFSVVFAPNYVSVIKETNNPLKTDLKQFVHINAALDHYKSVAMQAALIKAALTK